MSKKKIAIMLVSLVAGLLFFFWHTPLLIREPGNLVGLENSIVVNSQTDQNKGDFFVTTVRTRPATLFDMMRTLNDPFREIINQETAHNGLPVNASRLIQFNSMNTSQNSAKKVGLDLANKEASIRYQGILVLLVSKSSVFNGKLLSGDVVQTVNKKKFGHSSEMIEYMQSLHAGEEVEIKIQRQDHQKIVTGKVSYDKATGLQSIGVNFIDRTTLTSPIPVTIELGAVGGPSAGLMFALQIYSLASGHDLRQGRDIAGTGAITETGEVTRVGGIAEKVAASAEAGAAVFLVPDDFISKEVRKNLPTIKSNYQEALAAKKKLVTDMEIVPVQTAQDAVDWLAIEPLKE